MDKLTTYISMLRGINVGGARKILMKDLKALYEELGFQKVITYIQSGNVIFQAVDQMTDLQASEKIRKTIFQKYVFDVPCLVRTVDEMQRIIRINPLFGNKEVNIEKLHVTFLEEVPQQGYLSSIKRFDYSPDQFVIIGKDVFVYCPNGYGRSKINNEFFESQFKVTASTRNWRTVNTLADIAANIYSV